MTVSVLIESKEELLFKWEQARRNEVWKVKISSNKSLPYKESLKY